MQSPLTYSTLRLVTSLCLLTSITSARAEVLFQQPLRDVPYQIPVQVAMKGTNYTFFMDTGTTYITCDRSLTRKLGDFVEVQAMKVGSTKRELLTFQNPGIELGSWKLPNKPVGVVDLEFLQWGSGLNVRGLVGFEALKGAVVILDYDHKLLTIATDDTSIQNEHWSSVPMHESDEHSPAVAVEIEGVKADLILDTGADSTIDLDADTYSKLEKAGVIVTESQKMEMVSVAGIVKARSGTFVKGKLLGRPLKGIDVAEADGASGLGMGFLASFDSAWDFKNFQFSYKPRKGTPPIFLSNMLGAILSYDEKGATVQRLKPGGGAFENAGIHLGDHLSRIGSLKGSELNLLSLYELVRDNSDPTISIQVDQASEGPVTKVIQLGERKYLVPKND